MKDGLGALQRHVQTQRLERIDALVSRGPTPDKPIEEVQRADALRPLIDGADTPEPEIDRAAQQANERTGALAQKTIARLQAPLLETDAHSNAASNAQTAVAHLSAEARALAPLLSALAEAPHAAPQSPVDLSSATPQQAAEQLKQSVEQSGLFYESHLKAWSEGRHSLDALRNEPQNRAAALQRAFSSDDADASNRPTTERPAASEGMRLPSGMLSVMREQLDVLDFGRANWRGEVWPQQQAQIEIAPQAPSIDPAPARERRAEEREASAEQAAQSWRSTLRLDLPHLGEVEAQVVLDERGAHITVNAADDAAAALLRDSEALRLGLIDAGVQPAGLKIVRHG